MTLCSDGHEELCFEGRACPACKFKNELSDAENKIKELEAEIETLKENQP